MRLEINILKKVFLVFVCSTLVLNIRLVTLLGYPLYDDLRMVVVYTEKSFWYFPHRIALFFMLWFNPIHFTNILCCTEIHKKEIHWIPQFSVTRRTQQLRFRKNNFLEIDMPKQYQYTISWNYLSEDAQLNDSDLYCSCCVVWGDECESSLDLG